MIRYLTDWKLRGYHNYVPVLERSMEMNTEFTGILPEVLAKIPCSVYEPLYENGFIPDPYYECNSLQCEWAAARFWVFETSFTAANVGRCRLVFEGLDCKCDIWFNGKKIAESDNMYAPVVTDVTGAVLRGESNTVKIMFYNAPDEMGQYGYTSRVKTQKARFSYKWDFCPRLPSLGINGRVYFEEYAALAEDFDIRTDMYGNFSLSFRYDCFGDGASAKIEITDGDASVYSCLRPLKSAGRLRLKGFVDKVKLWSCNTAGTPHLYGLSVCIVRKGEILAEKNFRLGFKTLRVLPNEGAKQDAPPYLFELNGEKTYIKGANLAPIDMLYGRITDARIERLLSEVETMNANMVRVWGGGFIESEKFYDECDKRGLLVWQDFIQSSSGIDNHPSHDRAFMNNFMKTVRFAVGQKRNHVCTAVFCGGNEIAVGLERRPIDESDALIGKIGSYVRAHSAVHFVATTPCGANFAGDPDHPENNHDVHFPWLYLGDTEHYKYANRMQCLFHGEFGANGMSEASSLKKFLSEDHIRVTSFREDYVLRHHGELWDTYARDRAIFGDIQDVDTASKVSQFMQAEAIRYLIDGNRRRAFSNGGVMFWVFNEPYPNVSNLCVVDYYGKRKAAYYQIKNSYQNGYASAAYDKLVWKAGERLSVRPYAIAAQNGAFALDILVSCNQGTIADYRFSGEGKKDRATFTDEIFFTVPECDGIRFDFSLKSGNETYRSSIFLLVADKNGFASSEAVLRFNNTCMSDH